MEASASPKPILAPSILAGNHARLAESASLVKAHGLPWLHLDIMDGHFVPNLTFGPQTLRALKKEVDLFYDTHLMLSEPHRYIEPFAEAGADLISIHVEPSYDIAGTLRKIRNLGCQNGIVINPATPADAVRPYLSEVDLVLLMTVNPGYGGQSFMPGVLPKMRQIHTWREAARLSFRLEVDGGIDAHTAPLCRENGVDTFVAGTAFFKARDKSAFIRAVTTP